MLDPVCVHADGPLAPDQTVAALKLYGNLEAQLFASEPMITNPTNITVDARGRVWVCDVVNYRGNQGKRPAGDRILTLEDTDGDGRADKSTVFYQGHDVDSALGICVLGEKVIVSCSPEVFVLSDTDNDGRADDKEVLYTNTGDKQHDHSAHAFVFGPDGYLYWNVGNYHHGVFRADGAVVKDNFGREVHNDGKPYRQGMAFRQSFDGSKFEVLAHNLRNSYELTVDAFGDVWFTDNDDDGNRGTRFCFTLDGGNYGYTNELTGQGWRTERVGQHPEVPFRHWHQNDPGVVPNVLNNGSGSPSGVEVYEANLLPDGIRGSVVHCEPGHNVVRAYLPQANGAGYAAQSIELIDGRNDQWFRPVDVATAPDGSLMIADWYDPGVGGHRQADIDRGRIYRIAPKAAPYRPQLPDIATPDIACEALCSGNQAVRFEAWDALESWSENAEPALVKLSQSEDPRRRSRAYWLLTRFPESGAGHLLSAASDPEPRVRCAVTRMVEFASQAQAEDVFKQLADDPSPQVRRAVAIALRRYHEKDFAPRLWAQLAQQFDGEDRWYLEALGLAADSNWDQCIDAWLELAGRDAWRTPAGRMLIWRSRGSKTLAMLSELLSDKNTPSEELPRLLRALDLNANEEARDQLLDLARKSLTLPADQKWLVGCEALKLVELDETASEQLNEILPQLLKDSPRDRDFIDLVTRFRQTQYYGELFSLAIASSQGTEQSEKILRFLLRQDYADIFRQGLAASDQRAVHLAQMLANTGDRRAFDLLAPLIKDSSVEIEVRRELLRALVTNEPHAERLVEQDEAGTLPKELQATLVFALRASSWDSLSKRISKLHPELSDSKSESLPVGQWMKLPGNAKRGEQVFAGKATCATCHQVGNVGKQVGPALTEIGSKLGRTGLYESILYPSAAISHSYETYIALTEDGTAIKGVLISETDDTITLKTDKAVVRELRRDELEDFQKQKISLMPDGLHKLMTPQELADLVAYMSQLKKQPAVD